MTQPAPNPSPVTMWSASSWATWKMCPFKWKLKAEKWGRPRSKTDTRMAVHAMPGLVVDRLFELWLHRREFQDFAWLEANFSMVWNLVESRQKPKWQHEAETAYVQRQTWRSVGILFDLLHKHRLLNAEMGIQTDYHEEIATGISIAGAIDLWTILPNGKLLVVDFKNAGSNSRRSVDQLHFGALALGRLLGREPDEAAYVCFHPQCAGYRKVILRDCDRKKLLARLARATEARKAGTCPAKYSAFSCPRWCEVRFACPTFLARIKSKNSSAEQRASGG
ncbi:MAG: PD-(D/E)XK nuclease family protein [Planctomycetota bacterium]|nr:PD-(D/E)XK nuclease family protein [Planctomycetota bacterium]